MLLYLNFQVRDLCEPCMHAHYGKSIWRFLVSSLKDISCTPFQICLFYFSTKGESLYAVLGIEKASTPDEIKKAYRRVINCVTRLDWSLNCLSIKSIHGLFILKMCLIFLISFICALLSIQRSSPSAMRLFYHGWCADELHNTSQIKYI